MIFATFVGHFSMPKRLPFQQQESLYGKGDLLGIQEWREKDAFVESLRPPKKYEKGYLSLKFLDAGKDTGQRCPSMNILRRFYQTFSPRDSEDKGRLLGETFRPLENSGLGSLSRSPLVRRNCWNRRPFWLPEMRAGAPRMVMFSEPYIVAVNSPTIELRGGLHEHFLPPVSGLCPPWVARTRQWHSVTSHAYKAPTVVWTHFGLHNSSLSYMCFPTCVSTVNHFLLSAYLLVPDSSPICFHHLPPISASA